MTHFTHYIHVMCNEMMQDEMIWMNYDEIWHGTIESHHVQTSELAKISHVNTDFSLTKFGNLQSRQTIALHWIYL